MRSVIVSLIGLVSMSTASPEKGAILSRGATVQRRNLLDHQLRILDAAKLIHVELVGKLHDTTVGRTGLIERNGLDNLTAIGRSHTQLQVFLANRALLHYRKIAAPERLREAGSPGTGIAQLAGKPQVECRPWQRPVRDDRAEPFSVVSFSRANAMTGRWHRSRTRAAIRPTMPWCQVSS